MKITFANDYTTPGGRHFKAGTTAEVKDAEARSLVFRGKAVAATEKTAAKAATTKQTSATTEETKGPKS
jgi:ribosomal protein L9